MGCGTGNFFLNLKEHLCEKVGIDFSAESLRAYQEKRGIDKCVNIICADIEYLPFKEGYFDVIFIITVLQNLPDTKKSLEEVKRICRHGGKIILSLLKRKFGEAQIQQLIEKINLIPFKVIINEDCEDTIILFENEKN